MESLPEHLRRGVGSHDVDLGVLNIEPRDQSIGVEIGAWFDYSGFGDDLRQRFGLDYAIGEARDYNNLIGVWQ